MSFKIHRFLLLSLLIVLAKASYSHTNSPDTITRQNSEDTIVYQKSETMPTFIGRGTSLTEFVNDNLIFPTCPRKDKRKNIKIKVFFVVKYDGTVMRAEVRDPKIPKCYKDEAIRVIELTSGKWSPGKVGGNTVNVLCIMPIEFSIE